MVIVALDGFFIGLAVGKSGGLAEEEKVCGIGSAASGNQIVHLFLVKLGPLAMSLLGDTVDLGERKSIFFQLRRALVSAWCLFQGGAWHEASQQLVPNSEVHRGQGRAHAVQW